jgi:stalled ribosome alternative rescue factor ArfA
MSILKDRMKGFLPKPFLKHTPDVAPVVDTTKNAATDNKPKTRDFMRPVDNNQTVRDITNLNNNRKGSENTQVTAADLVGRKNDDPKAQVTDNKNSANVNDQLNATQIKEKDITKKGKGSDQTLASTIG